MPAHRQPEGQRRGLCRAAIDYIENGQTNHVIDGPPLIAVRAWGRPPILRGTHTSELKAGDPKVPDFLANQGLKRIRSVRGWRGETDGVQDALVRRFGVNGRGVRIVWLWRRYVLPRQRRLPC